MQIRSISTFPLLTSEARDPTWRKPTTVKAFRTHRPQLLPRNLRLFVVVVQSAYQGLARATGLVEARVGDGSTHDFVDQIIDGALWRNSW